MARFAVVLATFCVAVATAQKTPAFDQGVKMSTKAMQGACWYEFIYKLPNPNTPKDDGSAQSGCQMNLDMYKMEKQLADQGSTGEQAKKWMGQFMQGNLKQFFPAEYMRTCDSYLTEPEKAPATDMSSVLKDGSEPYPWKGFSHCILGQLKATYGKDATSALEEKWKYADGMPWREAINKRENDLRAHHGATPLQLDATLNARAQKWADQMAARCPNPIQLSDHIQSDNPDIKYNGQSMGESIYQQGSKGMNDDTGISAANSWYSEVTAYPWPSYEGNLRDRQFEAIGHFTAQVWKGSKLVGYGIGKRDGCDNTYVVARYWPAGNMGGVPGAFASNVGSYSR